MKMEDGELKVNEAYFKWLILSHLKNLNPQREAILGFVQAKITRDITEEFAAYLNKSGLVSKFYPYFLQIKIVTNKVLLRIQILQFS